MLQERLNIPNLDHTDKNEPQDHKIWLHAMMYRGRTERITTVVNLTPEMATAMLELNQGNRPIGLHRVKRHVDRLKAGTFLHNSRGLTTHRILGDFRIAVEVCLLNQQCGCSRTTTSP